jgi:hypothetical protein
MQRSASTWQYDVVCHLVERHRGCRRLGFFQTGDDFADYLRSYPGLSAWRVAKTHQHHPLFGELLAAGRAIAVYSFRDLRDVAFSLAHKCGCTFEEVVERRGGLHDCLADDRFWIAQPRTLVQRYEEVIADPEAGVDAIAGHLGIALTAGEAAAVAEEYSLRANAWRTVEVKQRLLGEGVNLDDPANASRKDEQTLLHWNHIREGKAGVWREQATPRQIALLAAICGTWLKDRDYEPDDSWSLPALEAIRTELAQAQSRLDELRRDLHAAEREIVSYQQLGPVALGVARRLHDFSLRYPRLGSALKRIVGRISPRKSL